VNDLRHDPNAHAPDRRDPTWFANSDTATVRVVAAGDLRTVPMPELRAPYGVPTSTDRIDALQQQVSTLQAVCSELSRRVAALEEVL